MDMLVGIASEQGESDEGVIVASSCPWPQKRDRAREEGEDASASRWCHVRGGT